MGLTSPRTMAIASAILLAMALPRLHAGSSRDEEPARLEFRILANLKHDRAAAEKARAADGLDHPPEGYRWVLMGWEISGAGAKVESRRITVPGAKWEENEFTDATVRLSGENLAGSDLSKDFTITRTRSDALELRPDPALFFKSVSSYRIDLTWRRMGLESTPDLIIREVPEGPGRVKKLILVQLDRHNVSEKDLNRVRKDLDERLNVAVLIEFSPEGGRKFGALTREHLPEEGGAFKYRLGIILDGRLMSAPVINSEIRDSGIIEGGPQGFKPEEVERIVKILREGQGKSK
jgi:SecD/SecF fusion protein